MPWRHVTRCQRQRWCAVPSCSLTLRAWAEWGQTRWPGYGGTSCWWAPSQPPCRSKQQQARQSGRKGLTHGHTWLSGRVNVWVADKTWNVLEDFPLCYIPTDGGLTVISRCFRGCLTVIVCVCTVWGAPAEWGRSWGWGQAGSAGGASCSSPWLPGLRALRGRGKRRQIQSWQDSF